MAWLLPRASYSVVSLVRQQFQADRSPREQNPMCYSMSQTAVARRHPKRELAALKLAILAVSVCDSRNRSGRSYHVLGCGRGWRESVWEKLRGGEEGGSDAIVFHFFHTFYLKQLLVIFHTNPSSSSPSSTPLLPPPSHPPPTP